MFKQGWLGWIEGERLAVKKWLNKGEEETPFGMKSNKKRH